MPHSHKVLPYEIDGDTLVVTPKGDSLSVEERMLEKEIAALHEMIDSPPLSHVLVNVGSSPYFSSLMMGAMIALCKRSTDSGGKAAMCSATGGMLESIQIMRLDTVIPHFPTPAEALAFVRG